MPVQPKSIVLIGATLVVGFALGLFVDARVLRARRDRRPQADGRVSPFASRVEAAIQPHSDAQRDSIDGAVQKVATDNAATMSAAIRQTRARTDSLRVVLAPMLDSAQRVRLDSVLSTTGRGGIVRGFVRGGASAGTPRPR